MNTNLTENQKTIARWFAQEFQNENLPEEFHLTWSQQGTIIVNYKGNAAQIPNITTGILEALQASGLLMLRSQYSRKGTLVGQNITLLGKLFKVVESDFDTPDTSFVTHLTPLADITNLDGEIKTRCLPTLGAGSADPRLWDAAIRTSLVILEDRLRDVGGITDRNKIGQALVNDIFGNSGTLATKFSVDSERQGYRDLYAGTVGVFRNPYGHRLIDTPPETGGTIIVFINLLLQMLEDYDNRNTSYKIISYNLIYPAQNTYTNNLSNSLPNTSIAANTQPRPIISKRLKLLDIFL